MAIVAVEATRIEKEFIAEEQETVTFYSDDSSDETSKNN